MILTAEEIQGAFYDLLKDTELAAALTGGVYREGYRPRDSRLEDAVVVFSAGLVDQIQTGVVTILIYVPDIDPFGNGVTVKDGKRVQELQRMAQDWLDSCPALQTCFKLRQKGIITSNPDEDIRQHFISIPLEYQYYDGED